MRPWQDDQLQILLTAEDKHGVFGGLAAVTRDLGFDHCAYGLRSLLPLSHQRIVMINNYPASWQTQYTERNYLSVDPTVRRALSSSLLILWNDDLFAHARDFWEDARGHGLRYGWA